MMEFSSLPKWGNVGVIDEGEEFSMLSPVWMEGKGRAQFGKCSFEGRKWNSQVGTFSRNQRQHSRDWSERTRWKVEIGVSFVRTLSKKQTEHL